MLFKTKMGERLINVLLLLMPFHYLLCECLLKKSSIDNVWRDLILIGLFSLIIFSMNGRIKLGNSGKAIIISNVIVIVFLLFAGNYQVAANISRTYITPTIIYFILININISNDLIQKWFKIIIAVAIIVSIYGIFQAFILGDSFLIDLGYTSSKGYLTSSFYINGFFGNQRVTGPLVSPNICGVFLGICLLLFFTSEKIIIKKKILFGLPMIIALVCTFSRSAIIAFVLAIISYKILQKLNKKNKLILNINTKLIVGIITCIVIAIPVLLFIDNYYLDGLVGRMLHSSAQLSDLSAEKHIEDLFMPINTIISNPFGLGFGNNGPKAFAYDVAANMVESSVYLSIYDFGILGAILFFLPYIKAIQFGLKNKKNKLALLTASVSVLLLFTYILLPNIQEYEPLFYFYFILGIANNKHVNENNVLY